MSYFKLGYFVEASILETMDSWTSWVSKLSSWIVTLSNTGTLVTELSRHRIMSHASISRLAKGQNVGPESGWMMLCSKALRHYISCLLAFLAKFGKQGSLDSFVFFAITRFNMISISRSTIRRVTQGSRRGHRICPGENHMDWAGLFRKAVPDHCTLQITHEWAHIRWYCLLHCLTDSLLDRSARRKSALWLSLLNRSILFSGAICICNTTTSDSEFDFYLVMTEFVQAKMADPKRGRKHKLLSSWWLQFVSK
jgi:hypothetical protein